MNVRARIVELARACDGQRGPEPWAREAGFRLGPNDRPSWCGLFARAIWRRAGVALPDWRMGEANLGYLRQLTAGERAQPGDLGYVLAKGHQAIVVRDDGENVISIDGNAADGRVVVDRARPRTDYAAFYSIDDLLEPPTQPAALPPTEGPRVLSVVPCKGEDVRRVQSALRDKGVPIVVDGVAGKGTTQALVQWAWRELRGN